MSDFVLVKICDNRLEADILKSYLEVEGIQVIIQADDAGGMLPPLNSLSGVRLFVPKDDFLRAQEIIR
jgi:hypothetical protein